MVARMSVWEGSSTELDSWAQAARGRVRPMVAGTAGNVGASWLLDRHKNRAFTLTLWESPEAEQASSKAAAASQAKSQQEAGARMLEVYELEIVDRIPSP